MRNVKKFLALVLAMLMVVSAAATVSAFEDVAEDNLFAEAIADLTVLEIVNGYDGETFGPEDAVTRQQFALMMARAITGIVGDDAVWAQGGLVGFEDVTEYQYAIATVVKAGIVDGFLDNTFRPDEGVTFIQALKMAVAALGYDDGNLDWWQGYYNVALDLGLTVNLNQITDADKALNRGEVAQLIWNMLYAPSANGSSLYEDIFAEPVVEPAEYTTFVITATDEQTAYEGMDAVEGGYVGVQQLINGVPTGDMIYLPVEMFGFEGDEDEAAFLSAYGFANYDAENGTFDEIVPVGESWKIYNTEISAVKNGKFTYDGKNYYPVEEITGTEIKNEVVLYNSTDYSYDDGNKQLFLNAKGEVLGKDGKVVLEAVYSVAGNIVSYLEVSTGKYLSVAKATATYGEVIDEIAQSYTIVDTAKLAGAYELTVYDDDMDGKMDRAYWTPVYVAAFAGVDSNNVHKTEGPFKGLDNDNGKVAGLDDLAKGNVFVYTYNEQLNEVNVIEVLEVQDDFVDYVSTLKLGDKYFTIETAEDEILTVYVGGNDVKVGATVKANGTVTKMTDITTDAKFGYVDAEDLYEELQHSMGIKYIERNGIIIYAEAYNIEDTYDLVVVKEVADLDIGTFYVDAYLNGALVELPVVALNNGVKTIDFSKISWLKQANYVDDFVEGGVYKLVELEDGYLLNEILVPTGNDKNVADFKLYEVGTSLVIEDNIEELTTARAERLRTNANTVWYFINNAGTENATVKTFSGEIEYGEIPAAATILADKLGYTESYKGVATEVYVFDANLAAVEGFGINKLTASEVYIPVSTVKYEYDTADVFGLDEAIYTERGYYKYANVGIDVNTGATVTVYSDHRLTANDKFYSVDHNGVIIDEVTTTMETATGAFDVVTADTYITMTVDGEDAVVYGDKVTTVYAIEAAATIAKKSGSDAEAKIDAATSAYYKINDKGVLVVIWTKTAAPIVPTYTAAADVTHSTHTGALEATVADKAVTTNLTATYTIYNAASDVAIGTAFTPVALGGNTVSKNSADLDDIRVRVYKLADSITEVDECLSKNGVDGFGWGLKEGSSFTDGVLTIKGINNPASSSYVFAAGTYSVEIEITHATGAAYVVSFDMVVPAV